jgi:hypothetical protein
LYWTLKPLKDLGRPVVHLDGELDVQLADRPAQQLVDRRIEFQDLRRLVELTLGDVERDCGLP